MIIVMQKGIGDREINPLVEKIKQAGLDVHLSRGKKITIIGVIGDKTKLDPDELQAMPGASALRGGAFKPRTNPYSFQGLAKAGLEILAEARAAVAVGADGLIIEVHPHPEKAMVDGPQSLNFAQFEGLMKECRPISGVLGRKM